MIDNLVPKGKFIVEQVRNGVVVAKRTVPNTVLTKGKDHMLNAMFGGEPDTSPWFIGLIENVGFTTILPSDYAGTHSGWTETPPASYNAGINRGTWDEATAASGSMGSTSVTTFTFIAAEVVEGIFIIDHVTSDAGTDIMWSAASFSEGELTMAVADVLNVSYTISL